MGADIHAVYEVYLSGTWVEITNKPRIHQQYATFAVLADVRNNREPYVPIAPPRGLPNDFRVNKGAMTDTAAADYMDHWERYRGLGDHSFSYHTLKHIVDYVVAARANLEVCKDWVTEQTYLNMRFDDAPPTWAPAEEAVIPEGHDFGKIRIVTRTMAEYEQYIAQSKSISYAVWRGAQLQRLDPQVWNTGKLPKLTLIHYEWKVADLDHTQLRSIMHEMVTLATTHQVGPEDVRIVFGFDS